MRDIDENTAYFEKLIREERWGDLKDALTQDKNELFRFNESYTTETERSCQWSAAPITKDTALLSEKARAYITEQVLDFNTRGSFLDNGKRVDWSWDPKVIIDC